MAIMGRGFYHDYINVSNYILELYEFVALFSVLWK